MGLQSGRRGFKSHLPAGVKEALHKFLKSSELPLPHLYKGENTEVGLAEESCNPLYLEDIIVSASKE